MKKYIKPETCITAISIEQILLTTSVYDNFAPDKGGKISDPLGEGEDWD